jgi:hypothetical protein
MSHWYGEQMECINDPRSGKLKEITNVFLKMEKYLDKLRENGLTLETSRSDDLNWRMALLKKIGAFPIEWIKEQHCYTSYEYAMKSGSKIPYRYYRVSDDKEVIAPIIEVD